MITLRVFQDHDAEMVLGKSGILSQLTGEIAFECSCKRFESFSGYGILKMCIIPEPNDKRLVLFQIVIESFVTAVRSIGYDNKTLVNHLRTAFKIMGIPCCFGHFVESTFIGHQRNVQFDSRSFAFKRSPRKPLFTHGNLSGIHEK